MAEKIASVWLILYATIHTSLSYVASDVPRITSASPNFTSGLSKDTSSTPIGTNGTSVITSGTSIVTSGTSIVTSGTSIVTSGTSLVTSGTSIATNGTSIVASGTPTLTGSPSHSTPAHNQELPNYSGYQVTENVVDIPDNRTLPPIVANYSITQPLNLANTSIVITKNPDNATEEISKLKKNTISILHIKAEYDEKPVQKENGIKKFFNGVKDYVYNIKKGLIDGIHSIFRVHAQHDTHDIFHDDIHRSLESDELDDFYDEK